MRYGGPTRSALQLEQLAQQMAHVLPARQWRIVQGLFDAVAHADGPFVFDASVAYRYAEVFRAAAAHPKMPADWGRFALDVADHASAAIRSGRPWRWS
jgi:hypothetical protein